ncbi:hypothetical protein [Jiella mangrovi]|uniref:Uncharacterized protein n=1 Tax=Jiella mangrovi TaxID=2821407 RepID=A0ABS4BN25_9HYPH|nr:hypothetical protein [Jiella mangrovi]MBP0617917.1 hypothetical protein [Jiella mangrovi]
MAELLSDRLFMLLLREVERLEDEIGENSPNKNSTEPFGGEGAGKIGVSAGRTSAKPASAGTKAASTRAGFKERADALILLTRTLEKLLELRAEESAAGQDDEAETLRLRDEFMRRLRALDARRAGGARLFADGAAKAGKPATKGRRRAKGPAPKPRDRDPDGGA